MTDAINPDVYKTGWSNGAELIDISENLNGNGAQIIQYVARSTRVDGVVKGNPLEDLTKARWFLDREIAKLEAAIAPTTTFDNGVRTRFPWVVEGDQSDDWREFPEGTRFQDSDGDAFVKREGKPYYLEDEDKPSWVIQNSTKDFAPYTVVADNPELSTSWVPGDEATDWTLFSDGTRFRDRCNLVHAFRIVDGQAVSDKSGKRYDPSELDEQCGPFVVIE